MLLEFALHELFVRPEVRAIADGFTVECSNLAFVQSCNSMGGNNFLDCVAGPRVNFIMCLLDLQPCTCV